MSDEEKQEKPRAAHLPEMWRRPCIRCGSTERRAKGLFRCKACRRLGRDFYNLPDGFSSGHGVGR